MESRQPQFIRGRGTKQTPDFARACSKKATLPLSSTSLGVSRLQATQVAIAALLTAQAAFAGDSSLRPLAGSQGRMHAPKPGTRLTPQLMVGCEGRYSVGALPA